MKGKSRRRFGILWLAALALAVAVIVWVALAPDVAKRTLGRADAGVVEVDVAGGRMRVTKYGFFHIESQRTYDTYLTLLYREYVGTVPPPEWKLIAETHWLSTKGEREAYVQSGTFKGCLNGTAADVFNSYSFTPEAKAEIAKQMLKLLQSEGDFRGYARALNALLDGPVPDVPYGINDLPQRN